MKCDLAKLYSGIFLFSFLIEPSPVWHSLRLPYAGRHRLADQSFRSETKSHTASDLMRQSEDREPGDGEGVERALNMSRCMLMAVEADFL